MFNSKLPCFNYCLNRIFQLTELHSQNDIKCIQHKLCFFHVVVQQLRLCNNHASTTMVVHLFITKFFMFISKLPCFNYCLNRIFQLTELHSQNDIKCIQHKLCFFHVVVQQLRLCNNHAFYNNFLHTHTNIYQEKEVESISTRTQLEYIYMLLYTRNIQLIIAPFTPSLSTPLLEKTDITSNTYTPLNNRYIQ